MRTRPILAGGLVAAATAAVAVGLTAHADPLPLAPTSTPIKHVVVLFDENESFDHYFGTYPNAANPAGQPRFTANLRQPMVLVAAGRDEIVSTLATEEFGLRLRAGAHLIVNGAKHELLMEQDRYRSQFLAAFDAFVPGTPLFA